MLPPEQIERLRDALTTAAGGYLRNPIRESYVTCAVCTAPVDDYKYCYACNMHRVFNGLADAVAPVIYAVGGRQSGYVMRGYKAQPPVEEHYIIVALLALLALSMHSDCPGRLVGAPLTHWAAVPSLPAKPGEHPLHRIVSRIAPGVEVPLVAAARVDNPRAVDSNHFSTTVQLASNSHVLLMDDTWTMGGHAQSAVLSLRKMGAAHVSVLLISRWINEEFGNNAKFMRETANRDYDPEICPWVAGGCP